MHFFLNSWTGLVDPGATKVIDNVVGFERSVFGNILNVVRIAGSGIALIMLTWMSLSYFTADGRGAPGAVERKADIKGHQLMNFAIGAAVFIGASNIIWFIANFIEAVLTRK